MAKRPKSLFEVILLPALITFFIGLAGIGVAVVNNWVGGKKDGETAKKALAPPPSPSSSADKVNKDGKKDTPPATAENPSREKNKLIPVFQPRSSPTTVLTVGHGKVEVTAQTIEEFRVVITIVGRGFGNDLSPLEEWKGKTGDLFHRKLKELALGSGTYVLVGNAGQPFTVRDGVASMELTFERK